MTYPHGPEHVHAHEPANRPSEIDTTGLPHDGTGTDTFIMIVGLLIAMLALIVSLGWIVFSHLVRG